MLHDAVARRRVWAGRAYCLARRSRLCADPGANPVRRAGCIRHLSRMPTPRMTDGYPTGDRHWQRLHQAIYLIGVLVLIHYFLRFKLIESTPTFATGLFGWLIGYRMLVWWRSTRSARSSPVFVSWRSCPNPTIPTLSSTCAKLRPPQPSLGSQLHR